jgi:hypothetical protein
MRLHLGIVYKDGNIINHRSLVKVFLNPILRLFGFQIVSRVLNNIITDIGIEHCYKTKIPKWYLRYDTKGCVVVKKRLLL